MKLIGLIDSGLLISVEAKRHERAIEGVTNPLGVFVNVRHIVS